LHLPSGRAIAYHGFGQKWVTTQYGRQRRMTFLDPRKNNIRVDTYGGRVTENITQAVARDVLSEAIIRLQEAGYKVVGHVHDEVIIEGTHDVDEVARIMCETTDWSEASRSPPRDRIRRGIARSDYGTNRAVQALRPREADGLGEAADRPAGAVV